MKRLIALLLALMMVFGQCVSLAEAVDGTDEDTHIVFEEDEWESQSEDDEDLFLDDEEDGEDASEDEDDEDDGEEIEDEEEEQIPWTEYDYDALRVGNPTPMDGKFFTDLWGNATSDIDVRNAIHGYSPTWWDNQIQFIADHNVVTDVEKTSGENGVTYTFTLQQDLTYNDGVTPITAREAFFTRAKQPSLPP